MADFLCDAYMWVVRLAPRLAQVLGIQQYGLTKDRFGFCFQAR